MQRLAICPAPDPGSVKFVTFTVDAVPSSKAKARTCSWKLGNLKIRLLCTPRQLDRKLLANTLSRQVGDALATVSAVMLQEHKDGCLPASGARSRRDHRAVVTYSMVQRCIPNQQKDGTATSLTKAPWWQAVDPPVPWLPLGTGHPAALPANWVRCRGRGCTPQPARNKASHRITKETLLAKHQVPGRFVEQSLPGPGFAPLAPSVGRHLRRRLSGRTNSRCLLMTLVDASNPYRWYESASIIFPAYQPTMPQLGTPGHRHGPTPFQ
uniref:Uncharacterized protein n=1 Tax=Sphaerodactylus townsendi TaxID=933632 RepID=A0ACB8FRI8_9SAUR